MAKPNKFFRFFGCDLIPLTDLIVMFLEEIIKMISFDVISHYPGDKDDLLQKILESLVDAAKFLKGYRFFEEEIETSLQTIIGELIVYVNSIEKIEIFPARRQMVLDFLGSVTVDQIVSKKRNASEITVSEDKENQPHSHPNKENTVNTGSFKKHKTSRNGLQSKTTEPSVV